MKLSREYYNNENVVELAKDLIGKVLIINRNDQKLSGIITETEAYRGYNDKACHANNGKRTKRNEIMYGDGGHAYIYLCYGIHLLFNIVTNAKDKADAVLIRGIIPLEGKEQIKRNRNRNLPLDKIGIGPGNVTKCFNINVKDNKVDLTGNSIWIEDKKIKVESIDTTPRIGIDYAQEDALLPWRFVGQFNHKKLTQL